MTKFQKRYFIEMLSNNKINTGHQHNAQMYFSRFESHLYDKSALSRFEILTKSLYKCNEDRPYYATQNQDIFMQYHEGFNFDKDKALQECKEVHITIPNKAPSITPYPTTPPNG